MQNKIVHRFLQPICDLFGKFSQKTRENIFVFLGVLFFLIPIINLFGKKTHLFSFRYLIIFSVLCVLMYLMAFDIVVEIKPVVLKKYPCIFLLILGITGLVSGFWVDSNHFDFAILFLIVLPLLFYILANADLALLVKLLIRSSKITFLLVICFSFLFFPVNGGKYQGLLFNQNALCLYLIVPIIFFMVEITDFSISKKTFFVDLLGLGSAVALVYYSSSRNGELSVLIVLFCFVIGGAFKGKQWLKKFCLKKLSMVAVSIVLMIFVILPFSQLMNSTVNKYYGDSEFIRIIQESKLETEKNDISLEEAFQKLKMNQNERYSLAGKTLNRLLTGRLDIWNGYIEHIGLIGNVDSDDFVVYKEGSFVHSSSHNTVIGISFSYGLIAGIAFLVLNIWSLINSLLYCKKEKNCDFSFVPLIISCVYVFMSLFEDMHTFGQIIFVLYLLALIPLVKNNRIE